MGTENVGVLEIDGGVFDWISRVDECLSFSVELDSVGGFVDPIGFEYFRLMLYLFCNDSDILLVHVLDVPY
jgi:hypothetical protein